MLAAPSLYVPAVSGVTAKGTMKVLAAKPDSYHNQKECVSHCPTKGYRIRAFRAGEDTLVRGGPQASQAPKPPNY